MGRNGIKSYNQDSANYKIRVQHFVEKLQQSIIWSDSQNFSWSGFEDKIVNLI